MKLKDRVAIITGANQGLGEELARKFAAEGAKLVLAARDAERLAQVARSLPTSEPLYWQATDISKIEQVDALVDLALTKFGRVDVLVNNAGVYGPIGPLEEIDWQEWCDALNVNLFGTVYMTRAVIGAMKSQRYGKIINLSGGGATAPLPRFSAYAASKAALVRLTETLAQELAEFGIDVNAIAPGALNTRLLDQVLEAGPERAGADFYRRSLQQRDSGGAPLSVGAELAVFLASAQSDGLSGRLLSAVWDNWAEMSQPNLRHKIQASDVYTLRRIVPEDRGWQKDS